MSLSSHLSVSFIQDASWLWNPKKTALSKEVLGNYLLKDLWISLILLTKLPPKRFSSIQPTCFPSYPQQSCFIGLSFAQDTSFYLSHIPDQHSAFKKIAAYFSPPKGKRQTLASFNFSILVFRNLCLHLLKWKVACFHLSWRNASSLSLQVYEDFLFCLSTVIISHTFVVYISLWIFKKWSEQDTRDLPAVSCREHVT